MTNKKKLIIAAIVIVIALAVSAVIGYFIWGYDYSSKKISIVIVDDKGNETLYEKQGTDAATLKEFLDTNKKFTIVYTTGMITSVNGLVADATKNQFFMIYSTDTENTNNAWGSHTLKDGTVASSAVAGADMLPITDGCTYVIVWQKF